MSTNALTAYDRQAHLAAWERMYPRRPEWPPYPRDDAEAAQAIAFYTDIEPSR